MKKTLYSLFIGLVALTLPGCDDDKDAVAFAVSTDKWSFAKEGGIQHLIVSSPGKWECTEKPDWCTLIPEKAAGPLEVKIDCSANEEKKREGTLVLTCGNKTCTIAVSQQGSYLLKGFPVEWLFTKDYFTSGKYTAAFEAENSLPAESGEGTISFVQDPANSGATITRKIGGTGHPYVKGHLKGDYWTISVPVKTTIPSHTVLHVKFITRSTTAGARYWTLEYLDGSDWKTLGNKRSVQVDGEGTISFTYDLVEDLTGSKKIGSDNAEVDEDFTLTKQVDAGQALQLRLRCESNLACNDTMRSPATTSGDHRIAGAVGTSPVISVISIDE